MALKGDYAPMPEGYKGNNHASFAPGAAMIEWAHRLDHPWKADRDTFEDYCREKWGWTRSYACRMIEAAEVMNVSPMGDNITSERQARELAKAAPEDRTANSKPAHAHRLRLGELFRCGWYP